MSVSECVRPAMSLIPSRVPGLVTLLGTQDTPRKQPPKIPASMELSVGDGSPEWGRQTSRVNKHTVIY